MTNRFCLPLYGPRDPSGFDELPANPNDPVLKLRLVHDLLELGWPRPHIAAALRISDRTLYRRVRDLKKIQAISRSTARPIDGD